MNIVRNSALLLAAVLLTLAGCAGADQAAQDAAQQTSATGEWITLFDGQSTEGWTMAGPGRFVVDDGALLTEGGMGLFYYEESPFRDFVLEFDWKANTDSANSGVFVRFPEKTDDPWYAVENGYEIQINATGDAAHASGAVYDHSGHFRDMSKPAGEWNHYRIEVTGQRYQVYLNGEKVNDFIGERGRQGYIGLQNHDPDSKVWFRDIRVQPLPSGGPESLGDIFATSNEGEQIDVLVVTATHGFRHRDAIAEAKEVLGELEGVTEFEFTFTEDVSDLNEANLAGYDVIFFNNSTLRVRAEAEEGEEGEILVTEAQQDAIMDFLADGKGVAAAHAGLDAFYGWDEYREMVGGGLFEEHPWTQPVRIEIEEEENPAVSHFGDGFWIRDEIYVLDQNPRWNSRVLASLDMESVGIEQGPADPTRNDYPIAWVRRHNGGRVFATKLGHFADVWATPDYVQHVLQGLRIAAGTVESKFGGHLEKTVIAEDVWPDDIAVDEQGNVWIAELRGKVHRYDAETEEVTQIAHVETTDPTKIEHGLYGIEVDPNFYDGEPYVYLFYAEPETFINTLSRFEYRNGQIDIGSEQVLLRVPTEPNCCHQAGDLEWGPDGTLYLSTGDTGMSETRPEWEISEAEIEAFEERYDLDGHHWSRLVDSERSAQNLTDLRGKILRINKDGTIPKDNPFYGEPGVRWEIYAYGLRNPYRFKVDPTNGYVYIGVVGPDEDVTYDEYNLSKVGGENFGWPREIGRLFYNEITPEDIPNYTPSLWEYTYQTGGRSATVGPIYRSDGEYAFPEIFQDKVFIYDWARRWIKWADVEKLTFTSDDDASRKEDPLGFSVETERLTNIKQFDQLLQTTPISMEIGPDGSLYLAEFDGFWDAGPNARVTRYRWIDDEEPPVVGAAGQAR